MSGEERGEGVRCLRAGGAARGAGSGVPERGQSYCHAAQLRTDAQTPWVSIP